MQTQSPVIILSAELSQLTQKDNNERSKRLRNMLKDLDVCFMPAKGYYKGSYEVSFVCMINNDTTMDVIKDFAFKDFNQESVLTQDANGLTRLVYSDGTVDKLARLRLVSESEAKSLDSYTELENGAIYATISE